MKKKKVSTVFGWTYELKCLAGPRLTRGRSEHCTVALPGGGRRVVVTGGFTTNGAVARVETVDFDNLSITTMAAMGRRREGHGCSIVTRGADHLVIVAGEFLDQPD